MKHTTENIYFRLFRKCCKSKNVYRRLQNFRTVLLHKNIYAFIHAFSKAR